jgi:hypothetical protein
MNPSGEGSTPQASELVALGGLLLLIGLAFAPVVAFEFVWDDHIVVEGVQGSGWSAVGTDLWAEVGGHAAGYFRPLFTASVLFDRWLHGGGPAGSHLQSLAWHLVAVVAAYAVARPRVGPAGAWATAAVLGLHPIAVEPVAWLAARNDLQALLLGLVALALTGGRFVGFAMPFAAMAALAKEPAYLLPLALIALDAGTPRWSWRGAGALLLGVLVAAALRLASGVGAGVAPDTAVLRVLAERLPLLSAHVLGLLTMPWPLEPAWSLDWGGASPQRIAAALLFVAFALLGLWRGHDRRMVLGGLLVAAIWTAPAAWALLRHGQFGTRYLYGALFGCGLALAAGLGGRARIGVGLLLLPWLVLVQLALPQWQNDRQLWETLGRDAPSPQVWTMLSQQAEAAGKGKDALGWAVAALSVAPPIVADCHRPVDLALAQGDPKLAVALGAWARDQGCPRTAQVAGSLGLARAWVGDWEGVERVLEGAPPDPRGLDRVAAAALALHRGDEAALGRLELGWEGPRDLRAEALRVVAGSAPAAADLHESQEGVSLPP